MELILGKGTAADSGAPLCHNITHQRLDSRSVGEFGVTIDKWDDPQGNFVFLVSFGFFILWSLFPWVFHGFPINLLFTILVGVIFILVPNCVSKAPEPLLKATSQTGLQLNLPRTLVARVGFIIPTSSLATINSWNQCKITINTYKTHTRI